MAKILFTWELGGNAGHVHPIGAIATELIERDHQVWVAVKDLAVGEKYLSHLGIDIIQAPTWKGRIKPNTLRSTVNFAELLMMVGYLDVDFIAGQLRSYINLIELIKPNVVLADHSPGALLAPRVLGVKAASISPGFFSPPVQPLMPSMQPWNEVPAQRFQISEQKVLNNINRALEQINSPPLKHLSDIFNRFPPYLLTFPESDHYPRNNSHYWGLIQSSKQAAEPIWPKIDKPKVFVYMQPNSKMFKPLMSSLKSLGWPSLVVARGITEKQATPFQASNIAFSAKPVSLRAVAETTDIAISNCNHGTVIELLQQGCRQLVIPEQAEQTMLAHRLASQGLVNIAGKSLPDYKELIELTEKSESLKARTKAFSTKYGYLKPEVQLSSLVDDIEKNFLQSPSA